MFNAHVYILYIWKWFNCTMSLKFCIDLYVHLVSNKITQLISVSVVTCEKLTLYRVRPSGWDGPQTMCDVECGPCHHSQTTW